MKISRIGAMGFLAVGFLAIPPAFPGDAPETMLEKAETALEKALTYMESRQTGGGWAMHWTSDEKLVFGEHALREPNIITVQPPATPAVGGTFIRAHEVLGDRRRLETAIRAGDALIAGQHESGGFPHEFYPGKQLERSGTFDDEVTQGATRFLIDLWLAGGGERFKDAAVRALEFMLDAQYENGGFPQAYPLRDNYSRYITLNDRAMMDAIRVLFLGGFVFGDRRYYDAAVRGADCLLELQGDPPQAAWAQQYTPEGEPAPARRFEPAGYSTSESMDAIRLLIEAYRYTGDSKYLGAIPAALKWFEESRLPNGRWSRLYELETNRPIYGLPEGGHTYDFTKARGGYGWQGDYLDRRVAEAFENLVRDGWRDVPEQMRSLRRGRRAPGVDEAAAIIADLDGRGRWTGPMGGRIADIYREGIGDPAGVQTIHTGTFARNAGALLDFIESQRRLEAMADRPALELKSEKDVVYGSANGRELRMDLDCPADPPETPMPVVIWIHGGAWLGGNKNNNQARRLANRGFFTASVEYRLSPEAKWPAQIHDCKAAVRYLRANAEKYGIDPNRIGVWGASAGGHLAAMLGTSGGVKDLEGQCGNPEASSAVQAVVDYFGPSDFATIGDPPSRIDHNAPDSPESRLIGGPLLDNPEAARHVSPIAYAGNGDPPFLIVHGDEDMTVPFHQSLVLYEALKEAGAEAELIRVRGGGHGGWDETTEPGNQTILLKVAEFFETHLMKPQGK